MSRNLSLRENQGNGIKNILLKVKNFIFLSGIFLLFVIIVSFAVYYFLYKTDTFLLVDEYEDTLTNIGINIAWIAQGLAIIFFIRFFSKKDRPFESFKKFLREIFAEEKSNVFVKIAQFFLGIFIIFLPFMLTFVLYYSLLSGVYLRGYFFLVGKPFQTVIVMQAEKSSSTKYIPPTIMRPDKQMGLSGILLDSKGISFKDEPPYILVKKEYRDGETTYYFKRGYLFYIEGTKTKYGYKVKENYKRVQSKEYLWKNVQHLKYEML